MARRARGCWTFAVVGLACAGVLALPAIAGARSDSPAVRPIQWAKLRGAPPSDPASTRLRAILLNSNRYALTTWWESKGYSQQPGPYLELGALAGPAYESFALSVSLATGAYDPAEVGVPRGEAEDRTLALVRSLAIGHRTHGADGWWGGGWQDALWAANAGYAGWLLWDRLSPVDRENVRRMVEAEANRLQDEEVPYFRDESGAVIRPGNTAAEENAWNSMLLQLATAMMPRHPNRHRWMDRNLELMISAFSRPDDVGDRRKLNGKRLSVWLNGSNIESNGVVMNHNRVHPDYATTIDFNLMAAAAYTLAGERTPAAAFHNADHVYDAMVDVEFPSPPFAAPGGTIYVEGSPQVYYPQGTDWSPSRIMIYGNLDAMARAFDFDDRASTKAPYWETLHAGAALAQQERHPDGKMYAPGEFNSEENDGAAVPARGYLASWLTGRRLVKLTDRAYPVPPRDRAPATLTLAAPAELVAGETERVVTTLDNRTQPRLTRVELSLELPDGWTAEPTSPATFRSVGEGEEVTTTWDVTAGAGAGLTDIVARARYRAVGRSESVERTTRAWVEPQNRIPRDQMTATASDAQSGYAAARAIDGDRDTIWHSQYRPPVPFPHSITLALDGAHDVTTLYYQPRLDSPNGVITSYKVYASADGSTFTEVAAGDWPLDGTTKAVSFDAPQARHIRLEALAGGGGYASAAELVLVGG
jgi:F5/8 type C domain/NPCBM-associated, NEW3 domain of alpha-galactosidase